MKIFPGSWTILFTLAARVYVEAGTSPEVMTLVRKFKPKVKNFFGCLFACGRATFGTGGYLGCMNNTSVSCRTSRLFLGNAWWHLCSTSWLSPHTPMSRKAKCSSSLAVPVRRTSVTVGTCASCIFVHDLRGLMKLFLRIKPPGVHTA